MDKDQLDGLLALRLVARRRNFTAAAEDLGVSPPAISKMIKQLERRLGVTLLNRTTRATSLTEAGARFLGQAGPGLDQILSAIAEVGSLGRKPAGTLRLNLPTLFYGSFLKPVVASFVKTYPEIALDLSFEDAASDVVAQGFDAGIRLSDILPKDMVAIKLFGPVRFIVIGAPKYFAKHGRPKCPRDLTGHDCLRVRLGQSIYDRWEFDLRGKPLEVRVKGTLIMNNALAAVTEALDGEALMYINEDAVAGLLRAGRLEAVLKPFAATSAGYYLYYPQTAAVPPKLRAFIDHVKAFQSPP